MGKSLDELLDDEAPEVEAEEQSEAEQPEPEAETPQEPEPEGQPRDESGKFAKKGVEPEKSQEAEPPSADKLPQDVYEPLKAVRSENKELKDQLEALKREMEARREPEPEPEPPASVWEDENKWGQQLVSAAVQQSTMGSRLMMSELLMEQQHEDFGGLKQQIFEFVGSNPAVNQQVAESQHPWMTAYRAYKNQQQMQELGATNIEELRATIREQERQAILAEAQKNVPVETPPTLSGERNVSSRRGPAWSGPKSLSDMLD